MFEGDFTSVIRVVFIELKLLVYRWCVADHSIKSWVVESSSGSVTFLASSIESTMVRSSDHLRPSVGVLASTPCADHGGI